MEAKSVRETHAVYYGRGHRHWRHGPPFPLFIFFLIFGLAHLTLFLGVLLLATLTAALVVAAIVLASQSAAPALRHLSSRAMSGRRRSRLASRYEPAELQLPGPALGPDAYRRRLLDVVKERYVR